MAEQLGRRQTRRVDETISYGASSLRDGVGITPREDLELVALPDQVMNRPKFHGFIRVSNARDGEPFPIATIRFDYVRRERRAPGLAPLTGPDPVDGFFTRLPEGRGEAAPEECFPTAFHSAGRAPCLPDAPIWSVWRARGAGSRGLMPDTHLTQLTSEIVAAFVERNAVSISDLPQLIRLVHGALESPASAQTAPPSRQRATAAQIRKSVTPDALVSFEDGRPYTMLRRHLRSCGLTPEEYRAKWGLPADYPMVAPNYSAKRSQVAKAVGLGVTTRRRMTTSAESQRHNSERERHPRP